MSEPMFPDRGGREGARAPKAKCTQPKDAIDGVLSLYAKICQLHHDRDAFPPPTSKTDKIELSS
jgi:hypothetical protein